MKSQDSQRKKVLTSIKQRLEVEKNLDSWGIPGGSTIVPSAVDVLSEQKKADAKAQISKPQKPTTYVYSPKPVDFTVGMSKVNIEPYATPPLPTAEKQAALDRLASQIKSCKNCSVNPNRRNAVPGIGPPDAQIMFIGEAPGEDEDEQGIPFVGRAGKLLTDIIEKGMRVKRETVFIANVLKCRPPNNATPTPQQAEVCGPYLEQQIEILRPKIICALGAVAARYLLAAPPTTMMKNLRGTVHSYRGIPVIVTYHPSYLLRNPEAKKDVWADIQILMGIVGLK